MPLSHAACSGAVRPVPVPKEWVRLPIALLIGQPVPGSSLEDDLTALGFAVRRAADAARAWDLLADVPAGRRVAVVDSRFVGHRQALRLGLTDPRFAAGAVPGAVTVVAPARQALAAALREDMGARRRAAPAAGPQVRAAAADVAAAQDRVGAPGEAGAGPAGPADPVGPPAEGLADRLAAALEARGTPVHRPDLGPLVAVVPADPVARAAARRGVAAVDEEAVRLRSAVKAHDGLFTTFCVSPYSRYLARWCARRGLAPNQVTTASLLTALIAAAAAATGTRSGYLAAGALLLFSFVLDCADGQLARYCLRYSALGGWLDASFDRVKEYAYYAGLAVGAAGGGDDVWALALGAMVLQTCRHVVDFAFAEAAPPETGRTGAAAVDGAVEGAVAADVADPTAGAAALSRRLDGVGWTVWARRVVVLPIGERWALTALLTAVATPRITLTALIVWSGLAACYTTAGRVLRSLSHRRAPGTAGAARALACFAGNGILADAVAAAWRHLVPGLPAFGAPAVAVLGGGTVVAVSACTASGSAWPVIAACVYCATSGLATARPLTGALDWLVPPLFRASEYGTFLVLAAQAQVNDTLLVSYGLVAAVTYHHYDTVYRIRGGTGAPPSRLVRSIGGHEGRTLLVTASAAALAGTRFTLALTALAVAVALVVLAETIRFWTVQTQFQMQPQPQPRTPWPAPAVPDEGGPA